MMNIIFSNSLNNYVFLLKRDEYLWNYIAKKVVAGFYFILNGKVGLEEQRCFIILFLRKYLGQIFAIISAC